MSLLTKMGRGHWKLVNNEDNESIEESLNEPQPMEAVMRVKTAKRSRWSLRDQWKHKIASLDGGVLKVFHSRQNDPSSLQFDLAETTIRRKGRSRKIRIRQIDNQYIYMKIHREEMTEWLKALVKHRIYRQGSIRSAQIQEVTSTTCNKDTITQKEKLELLQYNATVAVQALQTTMGALAQTIDALNHTANTVAQQMALRTRQNPTPVELEPEEAEPVFEWRTKLAAPAPSTQLNKWEIVKQLARRQLQLPLNLFEPLNDLQLVCEQMHHAKLLDKAVKESDQIRRMLYVCAFVISCYNDKLSHIRKPFQPLLGETYEFDRRKDLGWRFHSEKVGHRPSVAAASAQGKGWEWAHSISYKVNYAKVMQDQVDVESSGQTNLSLPQWHEQYAWNQGNVAIRNILKTEARYIVYSGSVSVRCSNGLQSKMEFLEKPSPGDYQVCGIVSDKDTKSLATIQAKWNGKVTAFYDDQVETLFRAPSAAQLDEKYYGFSKFAMSLNELRERELETLPPTDTRFRPDQRMLECGQLEDGAKTKRILEQNQRERMNEMKPLWFDCKKDSSGRELWFTNGKYWKCKEERFKKVPFTKLW